MKVLVIGSGGREHALAWKIAQSDRVTQVFIAPGNAGTARVGKNVPIEAHNLDKLLLFAEENAIGLTVVGPDDALAHGIVDLFSSAGLRIFGPNRAAARLEWSKAFAKEFMTRHGIPTARFQQFDSAVEAREASAQFGFPVAIKADGLALGKGVVIAREKEEAERAIQDMMEKRRFGEAGSRVVIEEYLSGPECSLHALIDAKSYALFPSAQDHKQLYEGSHGPNTGGMGTFSPSQKLTDALIEQIREQVLDRFMAGLKADGIHYAGLLFPGLILTAEGPKVLEFNCRFGDPETQVLMARLQSDLVDLLEATIDGKLATTAINWSPDPAVCVILASGGYPGYYETGKVIAGLVEAERSTQVQVFHAGTRREKDQVLTAGGRVLGVTATGNTLAAARQRTYEAVEKIGFDGRYFRRDIAAD